MPDLIFANKGAAEAIRNQEKINEGAKKLKDLYRADSREAANLERAAKRIYEQTRTPQEKMLGRIEKIRIAQKKGLIPPKEAESSIRRLEKGMGDLEKKTESVGETSQTTGDKIVGAFQSKAFGAISAVAASLLSVKDLLSGINADLDNLASKRIAGATGLGKLGQLAGSDSGKLAALVTASEKTFGEGAFNTVNEAANLTFELESAGALKRRGFFSQLQTIADAATIARSTALVRKSLGEDETGNLRALTSKSFAGAAPATGVTPSQISQGVAFAAPSAKKLGLKDEEVFAAVSRVAEITGSGVTSGQRVNALFTSLIKQGVADKSFGQILPKTIGAIAQQNLSEADLIKQLGTLEAAQALAALKDTRALTIRTREIFKAEREGLAGKSIATALRNPDIAIGRFTRGAEAKRELAFKEDARRQAVSTASRQLESAQFRQEDGLVLGAVKDKISAVGNAVGGGFGQRSVADAELRLFQSQEIRLLEEGNRQREENTEALHRVERKLEDSGFIAGSG